MEAKESYEERLKMVDMHNDVIQRIDKAIENNQPIEACWLCYACFENRITRTLEKLSEKCSQHRCYQNYKVGIVTRIDCIKRLSKEKYSGAEKFDNNLLGSIKAWCKERNRLVHALITLNNYEGMDKKFLDLAKKGKPLIEKIYSETTDFRNYYYEVENMPDFPANVESKCRLLRNIENQQKSG